MDYAKLAEMLFKNETKPLKYWFDKYPARNLPDTAEVTRLSPSPTGFLHLGALFMAVINQRIASDSNGVFYLRIEDTDREREVVGGKSLIINGLNEFGIKFDEGFLDEEKQFGEYGPYLQTERTDIYTSFARELVLQGRAYPCFMTKEELESQRKKQEIDKIRPGYYGQYAFWRNQPIEKIQEKLMNNTPYVLRFKSLGNQNVKRPFKDEFVGDIQIPQNDEDFVLLKTNGIPTYHFAHVVDDHLMGTTFVVRGLEWLSSIGKHLELWEALQLPVPKYGHLSPINKKEGSTLRKLSKRKDFEADIMRYKELGYPTDALVGYLYRLANPSFDDWWQHTNSVSLRDFHFSVKELQKSGSGPLIDLKKLDDISSDLIARMSAKEVAEKMIEWARKYDNDFADLITKEYQYLENILNIERDTEKPRKDITNWSTGKENIFYFFDSMFSVDKAKQEIIDVKLNFVGKDILGVLSSRISEERFFESDSLDLWLEEMRGLAGQIGFALDKNELKENPGKFKGDFSDFMKIIRISITGTNRTPNLFWIFKVMGKDRVLNRVKMVLGD